MTEDFAIEVSPWEEVTFFLGWKQSEIEANRALFLPYNAFKVISRMSCTCRYTLVFPIPKSLSERSNSSDHGGTVLEDTEAHLDTGPPLIAPSQGGSSTQSRPSHLFWRGQAPRWCHKACTWTQALYAMDGNVSLLKKPFLFMSNRGWEEHGLFAFCRTACLSCHF